MKSHFCISLVILNFCLTGHGKPADTPNIIYILADDLGYSEVGCYGQSKIRTPHLDRMAAEGMRFTQHYSGSAVCAPSRCVLLTGKHTGHAYIRGNDEWPKGVDVWKDRSIEGQRPLPTGTLTLGHLFQRADYQTACIGKWGLGTHDSTGDPNRQGFDHYYGYICQRQAHNYYPTHLWRNGEKDRLEGNRGHGQLVGSHYAADKMIDEAVWFLRENRERPFFLYFATPVPHVALQVPDDSLEEYEGAFPETPYEGKQGYLPHPKPRAAYAAMVTRMDRDIGRLMAELKALDLDENTLVLFSSDNGPTWAGGADSEFFESAGNLRGLKGQLFEGGIRVPMMARWPGRIAPDTVSDLPSAFWDVLPTLCDIVGIPIPPDTDGLSFAPTLLGKSELQQKHDWLYWEYARGQALRLGDWKGYRPKAKVDPNDPLQLYNLAKDPGESQDVAAKHPEVAKQILTIMKSARTESPIEKWQFASDPQ